MMNLSIQIPDKHGNIVVDDVVEDVVEDNVEKLRKRMLIYICEYESQKHAFTEEEIANVSGGLSADCMENHPQKYTHLNQKDNEYEKHLFVEWLKNVCGQPKCQ